MEPAGITNDNKNDLPSDPPAIPDQQLSSDKPNSSLATDKSSPTAKVHPKGPNGPAKRGIAAAIAAFGAPDCFWLLNTYIIMLLSLFDDFIPWLLDH
jgi:hypothetical protein